MTVDLEHDATTATPTSTCSFCGQPNFLPAGGEHPCCTFARMAGHQRCEGCTNFANRRMEGGG